MANSVDLIRRRVLRCPIRVCTICSGLSVRILRVSTIWKASVFFFLFFFIVFFFSVFFFFSCIVVNQRKRYAIIGVKYPDILSKYSYFQTVGYWYPIPLFPNSWVKIKRFKTRNFMWDKYCLNNIRLDVITDHDYNANFGHFSIISFRFISFTLFISVCGVCTQIQKWK